MKRSPPGDFPGGLFFIDMGEKEQVLRVSAFLPAWTAGPGRAILDFSPSPKPPTPPINQIS